MTVFLNAVEITDEYSALGVATAMVLINNHPTLQLRWTVADAQPNSDETAYGILNPRDNIQHTEIPLGATLWARTDRDGAKMNVVWQQLTVF